MPKQSLSTLNAQIASLQKKADQLRKQEVAGVVSQIKLAIREYGLTAADLGFGAKRQSKSNGKKLYRDPVSKATWTGHGRRPGWMVAALDAGRSMEDFRV